MPKLITRFFSRPLHEKLPAITSLAYLLISSPFIFGFLNPSIHEGNLYAVFYVIINIPVIFFFSLVSKNVEELLFGNLNIYASNLVFMFLGWLFWIFISRIIADMIEAITRKKKRTEAS